MSKPRKGKGSGQSKPAAQPEKTANKPLPPPKGYADVWIASSASLILDEGTENQK